MLISELIAKLEAVKAEHGDLHAGLMKDENGGYRAPDSFEVQELYETLPDGGWFDYSPWGGRPCPLVKMLGIF